MSNTYRAVSDRGLALYGGETFEAGFSAADERDQIDAGHLAIVPRPYKVLVNNFTGGKQDATVDLALLVEEEGALLAGGILERADPAPKKKSAK